MHMHDVYLRPMRTTIELRDEHRARLLELAARRGEKGFSRLIEEAVEKYLAEMAHHEERISAALAVLGTVDERGATELEETFHALRAGWR